MNRQKRMAPLGAALLAAREFKCLLDIQAPGTLFFPRHAGDARTTATYKFASDLLEQLSTQDLKGANGISLERRIALSVPGVVTNDGANVPANQLQLFAGISAAIAQLAFQLLDECGRGGEHGGSLEIGARFVSKGDVALEQVKGERDAVHEVTPSKVGKQPLCHGSVTAQEAR